MARTRWRFTNRHYAIGARASKENPRGNETRVSVSWSSLGQAFLRPALRASPQPFWRVWRAASAWPWKQRLWPERPSWPAVLSAAFAGLAAGALAGAAGLAAGLAALAARQQAPASSTLRPRGCNWSLCRRRFCRCGSCTDGFAPAVLPAGAGLCRQVQACRRAQAFVPFCQRAFLRTAVLRPHPGLRLRRLSTSSSLPSAEAPLGRIARSSSSSSPPIESRSSSGNASSESSSSNATSLILAPARFARDRLMVT